MPPPGEAPTDLFTCVAYTCRMMVRACARQHIDAAHTHAPNRDACIDCPAGAQRAHMLAIGEARCPVPVNGAGCPDKPEPGRQYCERHRFHVGGIARRSAVKTPVGEPRKRGRPRVENKAPKKKPKKDPKPRVERTCGECKRTHVSDRPFCCDCVGHAKRALRRRSESDDLDSAIAWLNTPREGRFSIPPCERCGRPKRLSPPGTEPGHGDWCSKCRIAALARLRKMGIPAPTPEQYATELRRMGSSLSRGGARVPVLGIPLRLAAATVAYSRVHTGVHYPGDVVGGALIGLTAGEVAPAVLAAVRRRWDIP